MHTLKFTQKIPLSLEKSWDFFSSPSNLKIITPEHMDFKICNELYGDKMYPGQIIEYRIRPLLNIPLKWVTEITHIMEPHYFVDEQRFGPYKFWHHQHWFEAIEGGILMTDIVNYSLPLGPLGNLINVLKVEQDLEQIFSFRKKKIIELFGEYHEKR